MCTHSSLATHTAPRSGHDPAVRADPQAAGPTGRPAAGSEAPGPELEEQRVEAFGERIVEALNSAGMLILFSLGDRTGLFEVLDRVGPTTSAELARAAGLEERYVREWLHGLTVAGVLELEGDEHFQLPAEHAALLHDGGAENLALYGQFISLAASVEDDLVSCFRDGGGVPYERFTRFHEVMAADSGQTVLSALHDDILPLVPGLHEGLRTGIDVADLGCGRGLVLLEMARTFPESRFVGWDLSEEAIGFAQVRAREEGLENVTFQVRDLSDFDETAEEDAFDLVTTFDAVHDQARPRRMLRGIARTLRPDGVYLMQDIHAHSHVGENMEHPLGPFLYTISLTHCMTVSLAQGGDGLGTMWGREQAEELLRDAGFDDIEVHQLDHDIQNDYWVVRHG